MSGLVGCIYIYIFFTKMPPIVTVVTLSQAIGITPCYMMSCPNVVMSKEPREVPRLPFL
jgi:hypothetical protein